MTDERLAEIQRLEQAATVGPWVYDASDPEQFIADANGDYVAWHTENWRLRQHPRANYPFIAAAREIVPELITEVLRLRAMLETR